MKQYYQEEWLEFLTSKYASRENPTCINLKRVEISEVIAPCDYSKKTNKNWCTVVMKNGKEYEVKMSYKKVIELV